MSSKFIMSAHGGKVSYALTRKHNSPTLTAEMMASVGMHVDEIVTTRDNALMHVYIHLLRKTRKDALEKAIKELSENGMEGTNIFGYNEIEGTSHVLSELIEDHPGFRILVRHQAEGNPNFNRWTAPGYGTNSGFNKLKNKLLSRHKSGPAADGGVGGDGGYEGASNDDDNEQLPRPRPSGSDGEKNKRRRTVSPDGGGGGMDASAVDLMKSIFEDSKRKNDDVTILKEKVLVNELTAKHQIALGEAALACTKLEADLEEEKAELQRMRRLLVIVCFHFIASII